MKRMQSDRVVCGVAALLALFGVPRADRAWCSTLNGHGSPPVLQSETADITPFPGFTAHDLAYSGLDAVTTGGIRIIDGDTAKTVATVYSSQYANFAWAPDDHTLYVSETYWALGDRGRREDVLSIYGGPTLRNEGEITLPERLISDPKTHAFALSPDGHYGYVYSFQPASSVSVVDLYGRKVITQVEIPGCGLVFPFGERGFASLCADGSLAVSDVNAKDRYILRRSKPFFDVLNDPVMDESVAESKSGLALFVTYDGWVHPVQLADTPRFAPPWSIEQAAGLSPATSTAGQITWRPGGQVPFAYERSRNRLFVLMHEGPPWTFEQGGTEIWVLDVSHHRLLHRWAVPQSAYLLAVTQDAHPLLFALSQTWLWVMNAESGEVGRAAPIVAPGMVSAKGE
ncbi:MAG TPA: amine dehydrogenase large subunit [Steroidobacteraceae bacterium]|nr:amine dehydrogenase large subunit [Steroidobacteraceae bacterium]